MAVYSRLCFLCIGKTYKAPYISVYTIIYSWAYNDFIYSNLIEEKHIPGSLYILFFMYILDNSYDNDLLRPQLIYEESCLSKGIA